MLGGRLPTKYTSRRPASCRRSGGVAAGKAHRPSASQRRPQPGLNPVPLVSASLGTEVNLLDKRVATGRSCCKGRAAALKSRSSSGPNRG